MAIVAIVVGLAAFALVASLPESSIPTAFSPRWWPNVLAGALTALGVGSLVFALRPAPHREVGVGEERGPAAATPAEPWSITRLSAVLGTTLAYVVAWQLLGYAVATAAYTVGLSALLGARGWRGLALFPAVVTASLVLFFDTLLGVPL